MPNIRSAVKKLRKDKKRATANLRVRKRYKRVVKSARENPGVESLKQAQKELDKAAKRGVIKKGKASRLKSRLSKLAHVD